MIGTRQPPDKKYRAAALGVLVENQVIQCGKCQKIRFGYYFDISYKKFELEEIRDLISQPL